MVFDAKRIDSLAAPIERWWDRNKEMKWMDRRSSVAATRTGLPIIFLATILLFGRPVLASAVDAPEPELNRLAAEFIMGNTYFVLLHEFGHVLVRDLELPILGLEENSADTLAAVTLIKLDQKYPDQEMRFVRILAMSALSNILTWKTGIETEHSDILYWVQHGLSVQRFSRVACLIYGSNVEDYTWIPEIVGMPEERSDWCDDEFALADTAVDWVLQTYATDSNPKDETRDMAAFTVSYSSPRTPKQKQMLALLRSNSVMERTAGFFFDTFSLDESLAIQVKACGMPNAWWDAEERELVFCFELLEAFLNLSKTDAAKAMAKQIRKLELASGKS